jgi:3-oxoadipate enol-lactonase
VNPYTFAEAGQARLAFRLFAAGPQAPAGATPMVLLHGGGGDGTSWDELAPAFAEHRPVYVPDLRGLGRSERTGPYTMPTLRDDLLALLDAWQVSRAVLIGHSLGAYAALLATQKAPSRVAALILEECPPPVPLGLEIPASIPDSAPFYDREMRPTVLATLNAPDPAWWSGLSTMETPTLVLAGGPESHLPQDEIARMAAAIPAGHLVTIPAGHSIHPNAPVAFTAAVESFLSEAPSRS